MKNIQKISIVGLLIIIAIICRYLSINVCLPVTLGYIRSFIYIGLFIAWAVSIKRRIIQLQIQHYLVAVSALEIFWMIIRMMKFFVFCEPHILNRYCWYMYYIPMLFIPVLAVFIAFALGKPESYKTPKVMHILWIPVILLFLLVLTNDLHQLVFSFPSGETWSDRDYSYKFGYWIIAGWCLICSVVTLICIFLKCRVPQSKKMLWFPILIFILFFMYMLLCALKSPVIHIIAGDFTVVVCLFIIAIFESCIQCGLIQSNTRYKELFYATDIGTQITDKNGNIYIYLQIRQ